MYIRPDLVASTLLELKHIKEVIRTYKGDNADNPRFDTLLSVCRNNLQKKIDIQQIHVSKNDSPVHGFVVAKADGSYTICYLHDLNNCEKRFVLRKELFQICIDDPAHHTLDLNSHIDDLLVGLNEPQHRGKTSSEVEIYPEIMTMELLFPWQTRKDLAENNNIDFMSIAQKYLIPRSMVELYLSNRFIESFQNLEKNELIKKMRLLPLILD